MYVFLSDVFHKFLLTPIFKKLDAFIPALSLLGSYVLCDVAWECDHSRSITQNVEDTNPCVFLFIILYTVNIHIFENQDLRFTWRQFSKSWTPSFLPYSVPRLRRYLPLFVCFHTKTASNDEDNQPLCVSFYYIIYIVNICIFECNISQTFIDANFQKAGRLHSCLIPAPVLFSSVLFVFSYLKYTTQKKTVVTNPCVFLFIILYI